MRSFRFLKCTPLSKFKPINNPLADGSVAVYVKRCSSTSSSKLQWSYAHGPGDTPLLGATIGQLLQQRTERHPDKTAVVFSATGDRLSFSELLDQADQLAAGLLTLGVKKGDRVGIWGPNSLEWVITQYATARAGIILVNINPQYRPSELEFTLKKVGCKVLIAAEEFKGQSYYEYLFHLVPELASSSTAQVHSHLLPDLKHIIMMGNKSHSGTLNFNDIMMAGTNENRAEILNLQNKVQFDEPINIQFTSGTTGNPKGATLSHHNIVNNSYFIAKRLNYDKNDTSICVPVPLYHCFGMVLGSLCTVTAGSTCVFPSPTFDAGQALKAAAQEKCTSMYGVPTMFIDMLNHHDFATFDLSSLYTGVMAGSPCPIETLKQVISRMNMDRVTVCYGLTETSPVTHQCYPTDDPEKRVSTVGRAQDHVECKVIKEDGTVCPISESGELCTRGYNTMLYYWDEPRKTKDVIGTDRWFHTGDIAVMDEDGFCKIVGRIKDMIIRGGENVYPTEIEQVIYKNPKVKDVQVVGVPDKRLGEEICAWIQVKENQSISEEEIKSYCRDRLARYKIPRYIMIVNEFPLTVTGKVQKYKIRDVAIEKLGLEHMTPN
ncbi:medium-chain acyl-CoA ligase ACSF2, mitochondrial-like [Ostrea edulis]|uniref:medium-chain acyl-CoA ligase ACSF2, mitochondrial-like n=1 Tax=Ostrea edulis TaxID=37623 RepID=UPI002096246A|nr:medium-chain acyl-CoA ligase ACSF2, mitochondrial-like [Ostrea edulis]